MNLPPPERAAFLLDLDGTLLDIAATPDAVVVAPGLLDSLRALRARCGGALGVVTGRTLAEVDALMKDAPYAAATEHGSVIRHVPGGPAVLQPVPQAPAVWLEAAARLAAAHEGVVMEAKRHGLVLHYRGAPEAGPELERTLRAMTEEQPGAFVLLSAKMAWEIRPAGVDKGGAVRALMQNPPFAGRLPIFVGDDVTDEDGIAAAEALGGIGLRVADAFGEPADVRRWIGRLGEGEGWQE